MDRRGLRLDDIPGDRYTDFEVLSKRRGSIAGTALDTRTERQVFIKIRNPASFKFKRWTGALVANEAELLESVNHPQIPTLVEANPCYEYPYIVMESMPNDPELSEWFENNADMDLAVRLCFSALSPVGHIHERNIAHRDIKPDNLLSPNEPPVFLTDFEFGRGKFSDLYVPPDWIVGTWGYTAPERLDGEIGDARSDLYSLGIVLYEFVFGRPAIISGETSEETFINNQIGEINFRSLRGRRVPKRLKEIIENAVQVNPADRYQSAEEMAYDLEEYLNRGKSRARQVATSLPAIQPQYAA